MTRIMSSQRKKDHSFNEVTIRHALDSQKDSVPKEVHDNAVAEYDRLAKLCNHIEKVPGYKQEIKQVKDSFHDVNCSYSNAPFPDEWRNLYGFLRAIGGRLDINVNMSLWKKYSIMTTLYNQFDGVEIPTMQHDQIENENVQERVYSYRSRGNSGNSYDTQSLKELPDVRLSAKKASLPNIHTNGRVNNNYAKQYEEKINTLEEQLAAKEKAVVAKKEESRKKINNMRRLLSEKDAKINELTTRIEAEAAAALSTPSPNDMSPEATVHLGESFAALYDEEWIEAFEAMRDDKKEDDVLQLLFSVVMGSYEYCLQHLRSKQQQIESTTVEKLSTVDSVPGVKADPTCVNFAKVLTTKTTKQLIKSTASSFIPTLCKAFKQKDERYRKLKKDSRVEKFVDKCVRLSWLMVLEDPPLHVTSAKIGGPFSTDAFTYYGKNGTKVKICVWPALYLHEGGPLLQKGRVYPV